MDIGSILGIIIAFGAILGGNAMEGGHMGSLLIFTAFFVVMGGTLGAILVQFTLPTIIQATKIAIWVFIPPKLEPKAAIEKLVDWSNIARKEGLLGLEAKVETETDPFAKKGLQLLVDGGEPESIRATLEVEVGTQEHSLTEAAKVFDGMGGYTPTVGIIGAVMGLIHVMNNLADPAALGPGIAVAFVATIYGVGMANLFFLPMGTKLKAHIHSKIKFQEMMIEGIISIAEGENPRNIEAKLSGYIHH